MTNRVMLAVTLSTIGAALLACGGSSSSSGPSTSCSGATPVALTVKNYLSWCDVSVNGRAASSAASQTTCVAAGSVPLTAQALPGFELGSKPWHDTTGDGGSGEQGTITGTGQSAMSATTATVSGAAACAWVCCETSGLSDCPSSDLCP
jgi:hypothetical protein